MDREHPRRRGADFAQLQRDREAIEFSFTYIAPLKTTLTRSLPRVREAPFIWRAAPVNHRAHGCRAVHEQGRAHRS